jgi:hypothetical protein
MGRPTQQALERGCWGERLLTANTSAREGPTCSFTSDCSQGDHDRSCPWEKVPRPAPLSGQTSLLLPVLGMGFYLGTKLFNSHYDVTISPIQAAA